MASTEQLWFRHPNICWALGDVKQLLGKDVELKCHADGQTYRVPNADTHPCDPSHVLDSDDIAAMNNMHEGPLLDLLHRRYKENVIYTYTGDILISINPYKSIAGLYDIPAEDYGDKKVPHVYAVAEKTYRMMMEETNPTRKNQSMIVSGESGAGKTEACKHVMRYLATLSERYCDRNLNRHSLGAQTVTIEKKVLDCNPFLEAFGNAKTVRNDNSSRFGKFLKIEYDGGRIMGARIRHYLLEKARVVSPNEGERNYHIFYQLARGATPQERTDLHIGPVEDFSYLITGGLAATFVEGVDDVAEFNDVRSALSDVGIAAEVQQDMFRVLSGLMHLGNVRFTENAAGEAALSTPEEAAIAAELLGCPLLPVKLVRRLMKVKGRNSSYEVTLNARQGAVARDSLAKTIYERMFSWLIDRTNRMLTSRAPSTAFVGILDIFGFEIFELNSFEQLCINYANEKLQNLFNHHIFVMEQEQYAAEGVDVTSIAFVNNQPCVDLIEKKPHGLLPTLDEICFLGRETTDGEYLDKIEKQHGKGKHEYYGNPKRRTTTDRFSVLHFAGEVTYCVDGFIEKNNDTLYTDLEELMTSSQFKFLTAVFDDSQLMGENAHDAHTHGHPVPAHGIPGGGAGASGSGSGASTPGGAGSGSDSPVVKVAKSGAAKSKTQSVSTIASKFKAQLGALNDTLLATTPHYIRCVKPNKVKKPSVFDHQMVLAQLLYAGVLETVRIRRQGFPFRETFVEFWRRATRVGFAILVPGARAVPLPPPPIYHNDAHGKAHDVSITKELSEVSKRGTMVVCKGLLPDGQWTTGRNKVFMKDGALDSIMKRFRTHHTTTLQSWWRMVKVRRAFWRYRKSLIKLQRAWRGILIRRKYAAVAVQITRLQAHFRRRRDQKRYARLKVARANAGKIVVGSIKSFTARRRFLRMKRGFGRLQSHYKVRKAKLELQKLRASLKILQAAARMFIARIKFRRMKHVRIHGCALIQAQWRGYQQRRVYRQKRSAAIVIQSSWRSQMARRERWKRFALIVFVQSCAKRWLARGRFSRLRRKVVTIQSWWKMIVLRREYMKERVAARRIEAAVYGSIAKKALQRWTQDLHAAASWGDVHELETVLLCKRPEYLRVRDIPVTERVRIRNRADGLKSPLHTAAAGGNMDAVKLLVTRGAEPGALDSFGSTPIHKSAQLGDANLNVLQALLSLFTNPTAVSNHPNVAGETALDVAVIASRNAPFGRREHDLTIRYLLSIGCNPSACGLSRQQIEALVSQPRPEQVASMAAAHREREMSERRARERAGDPHYQLLFVADQERKRKQEASEARRLQDSQAAVQAKKAAAINGVLWELGADTTASDVSPNANALQSPQQQQDQQRQQQLPRRSNSYYNNSNNNQQQQQSSSQRSPSTTQQPARRSLADQYSQLQQQQQQQQLQRVQSMRNTGVNAPVVVAEVVGADHLLLQAASAAVPAVAAAVPPSTSSSAPSPPGLVRQPSSSAVSSSSAPALSPAPLVSPRLNSSVGGFGSAAAAAIDASNNLNGVLNGGSAGGDFGSRSLSRSGARGAVGDNRTISGIGGGAGGTFGASAAMPSLPSFAVATFGPSGTSGSRQGGSHAYSSNGNRTMQQRGQAGAVNSGRLGGSSGDAAVSTARTTIVHGNSDYTGVTGGYGSGGTEYGGGAGGSTSPTSPRDDRVSAAAEVIASSLSSLAGSRAQGRSSGGGGGNDNNHGGSSGNAEVDVLGSHAGSSSSGMAAMTGFAASATGLLTANRGSNRNGGGSAIDRMDSAALLEISGTSGEDSDTDSDGEGDHADARVMRGRLRGYDGSGDEDDDEELSPAKPVVHLDTIVDSNVDTYPYAKGISGGGSAMAEMLLVPAVDSLHGLNGASAGDEADEGTYVGTAVPRASFTSGHHGQRPATAPSSASANNNNNTTNGNGITQYSGPASPPVSMAATAARGGFRPSPAAATAASSSSAAAAAAAMPRRVSPRARSPARPSTLDEVEGRSSSSTSTTTMAALTTTAMGSGRAVSTGTAAGAPTPSTTSSSSNTKVSSPRSPSTTRTASSSNTGGTGVIGNSGGGGGGAGKQSAFSSPTSSAAAAAIPPVFSSSSPALDNAPAPRSIRDHAIMPAHGLGSVASIGAASASVGVGAGGLASAAAMQSAQPAWTVHQSTSTGLLYYHNRHSGVTQWTEPADFDGQYTQSQVDLLLAVQTGPRARAAAAAGTASSASSSASPSLVPAGTSMSVNALATLSLPSPHEAPTASAATAAAVSSSSAAAGGSPSPSLKPAYSYSNILVAPSSRPTHPAPTAAAVADPGAALGSASPLALPVLSSPLLHSMAATNAASTYNLLQQQPSTPLVPAPSTRGLRPVSATIPASLLRQALPPLALVGAGVSTGPANQAAFTANGASASYSPTAAAAAVASSSSASASGRRVLGGGRGGWAAAMDGKGRPYYFHSGSGRVQWDRPAEF